MARSSCVSNIFRFLGALITLIGGGCAMAVNFGHGHKLKDYRFIFAVLIIIIMVGGSISLKYVHMVKWILKRLNLSVNQNWLVAFGTSAICDVFLITYSVNPFSVTPFVVFSFLALEVICVVAAGWDRDISGLTEGFFLGFGKILLVSLFFQKFIPTAISSFVLILALISKFTESAVEDDPPADAQV